MGQTYFIFSLWRLKNLLLFPDSDVKMTYKLIKTEMAGEMDHKREKSDCGWIS